MIKFKKILQKASGESSAHTMASFMLGAPRGPGAAALAQAVAEEEPQEMMAGETTAVAEDAGEDHSVSDELVASVLGDMFPPHASETADDNPADDEAMEESASGPSEETVEPEWASEGIEAQAAKEALLDDDAQVIFEQETLSEEAQTEAQAAKEALLDDDAQVIFEQETPSEEAQAAADVAQDVFEDAQTIEAASDFEAPGDDISAEDTVTLLDQISEATEGDLDAEAPSAEEPLEERASAQPQEDTVESMISDAFAAIDSPPEQALSSEEATQPEEEATPGLDQKFMSEVDRLLTEFGQVEEESPARETVESEDDDVSMQITKIEEEMAAIATEAGEASARDAKAAEEAVLEQSPENEAGSAAAEEEDDFADTLSPEEREALFAEGPDAQVSLPGDAAGLGALGELAEVELDFTPDTVGLSAPAEEAPPEDDDEDLLSRVLSDLDRLGDVSKPEATDDEAETGQEDDEDEGMDDFSNILDEINAEENYMEAAPVEETAPAPPHQKKGVKAEVLNKNDEQLIDEALNAGDEDVDVDGLGGGAAASSDTDDDQAALKEGSAAKAPEEADEKASAVEVGDPVDDADEGASGDLDEGDGLQDQDALLASLQASMDAAKDVDEDSDDSDKEEEAIRDEVLSRSKEVEQRVLDDVFGSNKDFRAELKAEMSQRDDARAGNADQTSALAVESQRLADERDASGEDVAMAVSLPTWIQNLDWGIWVAYQVNRPFQRFLNPERLKLLSNIAMALLLAASAWLAVAIMLFFQGS